MLKVVADPKYLNTISNKSSVESQSENGKFGCWFLSVDFDALHNESLLCVFVMMRSKNVSKHVFFHKYEIRN